MLQALLTIALLYAGALVSPGPNILLVTQLAASAGRAIAVQAALGIAAGAGLWASAVVLGLPVLFAVVPGLRELLQLAGASYLLYIAWRLWRSGMATGGDAARPVGGIAAFRLGLLTNLTNPKAALFFGSVFSTALPASPTPTLCVLAVLLIMASASGWYGWLAVMLSHPGVREAYAGRALLLGRLAALLLGSLAIALLVGALRSVGAPGAQM